MLLLLPASLPFFLTNVTVGAILTDTTAASPCGFSGCLQKHSKTPGSDHISMELVSECTAGFG